MQILIAVWVRVVEVSSHISGDSQCDPVRRLTYLPQRSLARNPFSMFDSA